VHIVDHFVRSIAALRPNNGLAARWERRSDVGLYWANNYGTDDEPETVLSSLRDHYEHRLGEHLRRTELTYDPEATKLSYSIGKPEFTMADIETIPKGDPSFARAVYFLKISLVPLLKHASIAARENKNQQLAQLKYVSLDTGRRNRLSPLLKVRSGP
jgi:hypothetical protein